MSTVETRVPCIMQLRLCIFGFNLGSLETPTALFSRPCFVPLSLRVCTTRKHIAASPPQRMRTFESDCNDGKGNAVACHQVGEYLSVVKNDFDKAAKIFGMNCNTRDHAPSCFNLGRFLRE